MTTRCINSRLLSLSLLELSKSPTLNCPHWFVVDLLIVIQLAVPFLFLYDETTDIP